jgi:dnd system-associated protein 4
MSDTKYTATEAGRDVVIERSKSELYAELQDTDGSPFKDAQRLEVFLFAMSYGSKKAGKKELKGDRQALFNISSLKEDQRWIIKSIAVQDAGTTDVLRDEKEVFRLAQEYANAGLEELHGKVFGPGDALSELSSDMIMMAEDS